MSFKIIHEEVEITPRELTVEEKKILTDCFIEGRDVYYAQHKYFIPPHLGKQSYNKKRAIAGKVEELMRGLAYNVDEETGEQVFIDVPTTEAELADTCFAFFPDCSREAFDYNISKIVETNGGWETFSNYFAQNVEEL